MKIENQADQRGISPVLLSIIVAAFIMAAYNNTFWGKAQRIFEGNTLHVALFGLAVFGLVLFIIALFSGKWLQKPFLILLLMTGGVSSYYMDTMGVMIDRDMIQNVMTTTMQEGKHLITFGFVSHVVIYAIIPSLFVLLVKVKRPPFVKALIRNVILAVFAFVLFAGLLMANYKTFSSAIRNNKDLMGSFQPGAPLTSTIRYANMMLNTRDIVLQPRGEDAVKGPLIMTAQKPVLTVIMVGETARAQNFGLLGYERNTTPELESIRDRITVFQDVSSCGTATATSLPCMFSRFGRSDYSYENGLANENLLDVLTHAGVNVEWYDNNTGDKGIAKRIGVNTSLTYLKDPVYCAVGECNDGIFMDVLKEKAATITQDTVLVFHMIGSHGPAYYLRYPKEYERFTPTCDKSELKDCSQDEIINTYDNTIAYTDHILAETIKFLQTQDNVIPAMFYMSDHGESLGENGIYLHGTPYFMAPDTQTRVPMILWFSQAYNNAFGLDPACMDTRAKQPATHENMFHTILGMMDINTSERNPDLDVVSACRTAAE
ncbi:phosphoethanolamine transferase [Profundibacter amoris]|uniref:Phosphoethanolamine--lipid A transferase n=1 Tax=Profundibacter amoris TaxID=2171755 RepID=A0A347UFX4_9RHOB|nr:phosphoethanolamine--lipid A transferase [Profundibacter amoris]AXX97752.1 phosphoethanolamine--lipid A transferase [Profundibacter amoris]